MNDRFDFVPYMPRRKRVSDLGNEYTQPGDGIDVTFGDGETYGGEVIECRRMASVVAQWAVRVRLGAKQGGGGQGRRNGSLVVVEVTG